MSAGQSRISKKQKETYTVLNFLGRGGFGETYLIKSDETRINYVIKRIFLDVLWGFTITSYKPDTLLIYQ